MISVKMYPRNKEFFIRLKTFCKSIIEVCEEVGITPVAYGGLVYFVYTKKKINVNDIDLLIPENSFEKLVNVFDRKKIKYNYSSEWHTLQVFKGQLKIELDSIDYWYKDMPRDFKKLDFDGLIVKAVSLEGLKAVYKKASERSKDKPVKYRKKFNVLKKLK